MKKFWVAASAALLLCWGGAFADVELFDDEDLEDVESWSSWVEGDDGLDLGSVVTVETGSPLKVVLKLGNHSGDDYPYLGVGTYGFGVKTMETLTGIKVSYTASPSKPILVSIPTKRTYEGEQVSYQATLTNGSVISLDKFTPPEWMTDEPDEEDEDAPAPYDGPANLSLVDKGDIEAGIAFSHESEGTPVTLEVTSIIFLGVEWDDDDDGREAISTKRAAKLSGISITGISAGKLGLRVPSAGNYSVAIYGVNGKMLVKTKANLVQGANTLAISKNLAKGIAIVRIQGANATLVKKISVK